MGCHFLFQYMKVKSESEVAQSCLTFSDPMDCSPPSSSMGFSRQEYCRVILACVKSLLYAEYVYTATPEPVLFPSYKWGN